MIAKLHSVAITGIDAVPVEVELDDAPGFPGTRIVGLPDKAVREALDRVQTAVRNSGYDFPATRRLIYSLAPAELRKEGAMYDLPIALVTLLSSGQLNPAAIDVEEWLILGELALDGRLRPVRGALAAAIAAKEAGKTGVIVPAHNLAEASAIEGIRAIGVESLAQAAQFIAGTWAPEQAPPAPPEPEPKSLLCFSDLRGQEMIKRALLVAAAGAHHCLLMGPPGSGKTMAAQRLPGILPPLTLQESLQTTKIHSVAGELAPGQGLLHQRPFRAPHHTASPSGLIGGGTIPRPGEISLAHNGVLYLDEAPEFPRHLLETLRQPLEDGVITISRAGGAAQFPARVQLILSMNLCPCGRLGDPRRQCRCTPNQIRAYVSRLSGPLLDRIDIHVEVPPVDHDKLLERRTGANSVQMAEQVARARAIQSKRYAGRETAVNAAMLPRDLEEFCALDRQCETVLRSAMTQYGLSARAYGRILKVARTIADLDGAPNIALEHLMESIQYRRADRE